MDIKNKKILSGLILVLIIFHVIANIAWHSFNEFPQGKDTFEHLNKAANAIRLFKGDFNPFFYKYNHSFIYNLIFLNYHYPSGYYLLTALFYNTFSNLAGFKIIYLPSLVFFIILILSVYKIGFHYFNNFTGFFCAFICSFMPIIYFSSRQFNLELAVTSLVVLTYYLIIKSDNFTNKKYTILAGLTAGISLLFKYTALVFVFAMVLKTVYEINHSLKTDCYQLNKRKVITNFLLFILSMFFVASIYYAHPLVIKTLLWHASCQDYLWEIPRRLGYYCIGFLLDAQGAVISLILLIILLTLHKEKKSRRMFIFLIGIPYLITSLVPKRPPLTEIEFLLTSVPFAAIFIAARLSLIKNLKAKCFAITFTTIYLISQFFISSFLPPVKIKFIPYSAYNFPLSFWGYSLPPIKEYACKSVLDYISKNTNNPIKIGAINHPDSMDIFSAIFGSYVYFNKKPWGIKYFSADKNQRYDNLLKYDYLIYTANKFDNFILKDSRLTSIKNKSKLVRIYKFESFNRGSTFEEFVFLYKKSP